MNVQPMQIATKGNPDRCGIYIDSLTEIIHRLNDSLILQRIFGSPVSHSLVIVADGNDLRIEEGGRVHLTPQQADEFLAVLGDAIESCSISPSWQTSKPP